MARSRQPLTVSKTVAGIKISTVSGSGLWKTADGRFEFSKDDNAVTTVDNPERQDHDGWGMTNVTTWSAWDTVTDDHAFNGDTGYDTLTEAVEWVASNLKEN